MNTEKQNKHILRGNKNLKPNNENLKDTYIDNNYIGRFDDFPIKNFDGLGDNISDNIILNSTNDQICFIQDDGIRIFNAESIKNYSIEQIFTFELSDGIKVNVSVGDSQFVQQEIKKFLKKK